MAFVYEYGMFLAKALTVVVSILIVLAGISAVAGRDREQGRESLRVRKLNNRYRDMRRTLSNAMTERKLFQRFRRSGRQTDTDHPTQGEPPAQGPKHRVYLLRFEGDIRASRVENLREEVTAVLTQARPGQDEVVLCLESPGGLVHSYGLAASQLTRLRDRGIRLTAAVDRVAASGGYLMASVADRIVAAPFAVVGSIGVVAQLPNIHRLLKRHDVDVEMHTAGQHKRTLTTLGENTHAGRRKFQQELDEIHGLFKRFVHRYRPSLDLEQVATGEHWYGEQAVDLNLVDALQTSDDLLMAKAEEADVFEVTFRRKQSISKRITLGIETALERLLRGGH
ncbi:protease SohB [Aquisalimonas asiatica]|uniref:Serine protease SohB n=1 Tax=Aquisalimonas asiatica TaxID=406100 RepID=A0A1H8TLR0_9GAMM|nr:protease SohB [Aquisalimonas asiatica]SEO92000.1 serine protease SohB [Aquisalimonas asiatica]